MNKKILSIAVSALVVLGITFSSTGAWIGLVAEVGDILNTTKWNEMITELNTKISQSNVFGSGSIEVTASGATDVVISFSGGVNGLNTETITVANGACLTTTTDHNRYMNAYAEIVTTTPGTEFTPVGTIDPDNNSTGDANMINNNYTDLAYNNSSAGSANKSLPAVDLGASSAGGVVRIYWWNPGTYGTTDGRIQGSNNGTTWTDLVTGIVRTSGATGDSDDFAVTGSYRYYRFFNVTGLNATWVVLSETEVFAVGTTSSEFIHVSSRDIELKNNGGLLEVCNNEVTPLDIEINSLQ